MPEPRQHRGRRPDRNDKPKEQSDIAEKVVFINRCAKVVKGGRRFSFSALIVSGDRKGRVGFGFGKANEVAEAIRKASESAKKSLVKVAVHGNTIPHEVIGEHGGGRVLLRPASPGTGIIAGGGVRAVVEAAGIRDVLAKSLGSSNHANVVKATLAALHQLRLKEEIFKLRGITVRPKGATMTAEAAAATLA
jgi:small subunit ribosomal protein S5